MVSVQIVLQVLKLTLVRQIFCFIETTGRLFASTGTS